MTYHMQSLQDICTVYILFLPRVTEEWRLWENNSHKSQVRRHYEYNLLVRMVILLLLLFKRCLFQITDAVAHQKSL